MPLDRYARKALLAIAAAASLTLAAGCSESAPREDPVVATATITETTAVPAVSPTLADPGEGGGGENPGVTEDEGSDGEASEAEGSADEGNTRCSDLGGQAAVDRWVSQVPTYNDWRWDADSATVENYDPCLPLSWIVLPIENGTASSPYQIMLFNQGEYLGTATSEAYGFGPDVMRLDDETIQVTWYWPREGESNAARSGTSTAQFHWDDAQGKVEMTGEVPD